MVFGLSFIALKELWRYSLAINDTFAEQHGQAIAPWFFKDVRLNIRVEIKKKYKGKIVLKKKNV